jgi:antitoxin (DNA-binding transcriptional repressor) of toxin-antitoxin stability system
MRFVSVRDFRANLNLILRDLKKEKQAVLTRRGKPVAMVTATDEKHVADTLMETARREAKEALEQIQQESVKNGTSGMSMEEIDAEIAQYRRERRAKRGARK